MFLSHRSLAQTLVLLSLCILTGCSGSKPTDTVSTSTGLPEAKDGLLDLHNLLVELKTNGGKLPTKPADFTQHDVAFPVAGTLGANGTIVYLYGATIDPSVTPPKLVAMQAGADKSGGYVLLSNGEVKDLPAAEVAALPPGGKLSK